jgi:cell division protein FtsL
MVAAMVCAACVAGAVLGVVALKVQQVRLSYRLDELRTARAQALETNRRLGVELASLSSPARLERRARTELGMIQPSREQVRLAREFVPGGTGAAAAERRTAAAGRLAPARGVSR